MTNVFTTHQRRVGRRHRRGLLVVVLPVLALALVANGCAVLPRLIVSTVVTGLYKPWDIAFTPDGTMLYTSKVHGIGTNFGGTPHFLTGGPTDSVFQNEGGILGLAVDPDFTNNRFIYVAILSNTNPALDERVLRYTVSADYSSLSDRVDILTGIPVGQSIVPASGRGSHIGGRIRFGPDGFLYVTTGDALIPTGPQDPQSLVGKVLRIDRDGNPAPGNPGGAFRPEVYTMGHRNVQGIAFRPSDGKPFGIEHGTNCDDEVNELVPGGNYGWDPTPAPGIVLEPPFSFLGYWAFAPMTDTARHPDAIAPVWSSGCPTIAPSGGTFLQGSQWHSWNGAIAMAILRDMHLHIVIPHTTSEWKVVTDHGRLRSAVQGPDGDLYICQDNEGGDATIFKVHAT